MTLPIEIDPSRRRKIRLLICDVDGVLTDATLTYGADGEVVKHFNAKDGLGIRMLDAIGISVAIITARDSAPLKARIKDLGIKYFYPGRDNKVVALNEMNQTLRLEMNQIAYVGDDILDIPIMRKVGLPISVSDGHELVQSEATATTKTGGGQGAVREICDALIEAHCPLSKACDDFLSSNLGNSLLTTA